MRYARIRRADAERPLTRIDGSRPGDSNIIYDKGGYAAWMMMRLIGREPMLTGLREFIALYRENPDHPVLQDYLAVMRRHAADTTAFDAFTKQWYFDVVVPEYRLSDAKAVKQGAEWIVHAKIRNAGTSTMPVEVAAARGKRFGDLKKKEEPYLDARTTVVLGPKQSREVVIRCAFEPERVLADPDLMVLQLERNKATAKVEIDKTTSVALR
jgi:hypothetical protein